MPGMKMETSIAAGLMYKNNGVQWQAEFSVPLDTQ